jgi:hypothetical protein
MVNFGVAWAVATKPATLLILAVTLALAWPLGRRGGPAGVLFVLVLGGILAATTTTSVPFVSLEGIRPYLAEFDDPSYLFGGFAGNQERVANILLFLPLGLLGTLLWRRPAAVFAACVTLTFLVEAWQGFIGRGGDAVDVVHNSVGALLGVLLARGWIYLASQGTV